MIAKNNVLNIRSTSSRWRGKVGSSRGFCDFDSVESCIRVGLYLLERTYFKRGFKSMHDIIYTFAPPSDGNDSKHYLSYVCQSANIASYQVYINLSCYAKYLVFRAMCTIETGYSLSYEVFTKVYNRFKNEK